MKNKYISVIGFLFSVVGIWLVGLLLFSLEPVSAEGENVSVSIQNNVNSSSSSNTSVHKRIEINVNGQQKVIESDQPGNTSVQVNTNGMSSPTIVITETPAITISPKVSNKQNINNMIQQFMNKVKKEIDALMKSIFGSR